MTRPFHPTMLGRRLRQAREARGWTQSELARRADVRASSLSRVESGSIVSPSGEFLAQVAGVLGVSVDTLMRGEDNPDDARTMSFSPRFEIFQHQLAALPPELAESLLTMWESSLETARLARKLREN